MGFPLAIKAHCCNPKENLGFRPWYLGFILLGLLQNGPKWATYMWAAAGTSVFRQALHGGVWSQSGRPTDPTTEGEAGPWPPGEGKECIPPDCSHGKLHACPASPNSCTRQLQNRFILFRYVQTLLDIWLMSFFSSGTYVLFLLHDVINT